MLKKVVIGLSGGVDSAVACFLLKQQGYDVHAVFMQNWDSYVNQEAYNNHKDKCDAQYEWEDAQAVAKHLNIPITKVDFIKEYWNEVFTEFINDYKQGYTPNPDVLCNQYIKFGHLLAYAKQHFNCDYLATGHYAKVIHFNDHSELHRCADENKDQTYFLCGLSQAQLKMCLFPLYDLTKTQVREIAKNNSIPVWNKKDSTGICFIGKRDFREFLSNYIPNQTGKIIDIVTHKTIGEHCGTMYYTIGQNDGLGLGGQTTKYFVCAKDIANCIIYVTDEQHKDQYLISHHCTVKNFNWINPAMGRHQLTARFRHRQALINVTIDNIDNTLKLNYKDGASAVTCGQYAVLYQGTNCLGGGIITKTEK